MDRIDQDSQLVGAPRQRQRGPTVGHWPQRRVQLCRPPSNIGWFVRATRRPASVVPVARHHTRGGPAIDRAWQLSSAVGREIRCQRASMDRPTIEDSRDRRIVCAADAFQRLGRCLANASELSHASVRNHDRLLIGPGFQSQRGCVHGFLDLDLRGQTTTIRSRSRRDDESMVRDDSDVRTRFVVILA